MLLFVLQGVHFNGLLLETLQVLSVDVVITVKSNLLDKICHALMLNLFIAFCNNFLRFQNQFVSKKMQDIGLVLELRRCLLWNYFLKHSCAAYADQHLTGKHQNQDVCELFQVMLNLVFPERSRRSVRC